MSQPDILGELRALSQHAYVPAFVRERLVRACAEIERLRGPRVVGEFHGVPVVADPAMGPNERPIMVKTRHLPIDFKVDPALEACVRADEAIDADVDKMLDYEFEKFDRMMMGDRNPSSLRSCPNCGRDGSHLAVGAVNARALGEPWYRSTPSVQVVCLCGMRGPMVPETQDVCGGAARLAWNTAVELGALQRHNVEMLAKSLKS